MGSARRARRAVAPDGLPAGRGDWIRACEALEFAGQRGISRQRCSELAAWLDEYERRFGPPVRRNGKPCRPWRDVLGVRPGQFVPADPVGPEPARDYTDADWKSL